MIPTAETEYRAVGGRPAAERAIHQHWTRRDVGRFVPTATAAGASAHAVVNHGRWIVRCPFCTSAQFASREDKRFFCVECLNEQAGRRWVRVVWPKVADMATIEGALESRADQRTRNWEPGESPADLKRENAARGVE